MQKLVRNFTVKTSHLQHVSIFHRSSSSGRPHNNQKV